MFDDSLEEREVVQ